MSKAEFKKMTKQRLIKDLQEMLKHGYNRKFTKDGISDFLEAYNDIIVKSLITTEKFSFPNHSVGTLKRVTRAARKGKNPKTGEDVQVPEKVSVTFRPSKSLKETLNCGMRS